MHMAVTPTITAATTTAAPTMAPTSTMWSWSAVLLAVAAGVVGSGLIPTATGDTVVATQPAPSASFAASHGANDTADASGAVADTDVVVKLAGSVVAVVETARSCINA